MSQASSTSRKTLYIGGLDAAVTEPTLRAAFIPFGPISSIDMPMDYAAGTHKGYAFLEFVDGEDAAEAIYNMDGAELFGKTLVVNVAQADRLAAGSNDLTSAKQAVWSTDEWYREHAGGDEGKDEEQENGKEKKILA